MASKKQQLRKLVEKGISNKTGHCIKKMTVYNELTYIENRHLEDYFMIAHKLMTQLKTTEDLYVCLQNMSCYGVTQPRIQ